MWTTRATIAPEGYPTETSAHRSVKAEPDAAPSDDFCRNRCRLVLSLNSLLFDQTRGAARRRPARRRRGRGPRAQQQSLLHLSGERASRSVSPRHLTRQPATSLVDSLFALADGPDTNIVIIPTAFDGLPPLLPGRAGKSTVAPHVAALLEAPTLDVDRAFEAAHVDVDRFIETGGYAA